MSDDALDIALARYVKQTGMAAAEQVTAALRAQASAAEQGTPIPLGEALVRLGVLTPPQREAAEKKVHAQKQLGGYKLLRKLGEGGMGAVYLAEKDGRKVALKVLPRRLAADVEFVKRFRREAEAASQLDHPNIVRALDAGEELGYHYYAMEYCEGEGLDARLKRERTLPVSEALDLTLQVARGLQHAHERGFLHRDIKPANVFLTRDGAAKILDLGLSRKIEETHASFRTVSGAVLGTPHYISPEQARGEREIDGRTDLYSLGATLYHLLTGSTPFEGSSAFEVVAKHVNAQLPNPQDFRDDIPDAVVQLIQRMMAKAPADRPAGAADLVRELKELISGTTPKTLVLDPSRSSIAPPRRRVAARPPPARRRPLLPWIGAGAVVGGVVLIVVLRLLLRGGPELVPPPPARVGPAPPALQVIREVPLWAVIGPFNAQHGLDLDAEHPPDREEEFGRIYPGKAGPVRWQAIPALDGEVELHEELEPKTFAVAYAFTLLHSPADAAARLRLGSDDAARVWLNGALVHQALKQRAVHAEADEIPLRLRKGANRLMLKVAQGTGEWGFVATIEGAAGLTCSLPPPLARSAEDDSWARGVAGLPAGEQVRAVVARLKIMNPEYSGGEFHRTEGGAVVELVLKAHGLRDLGPLSVLRRLKVLRLERAPGERSPLHDLSPLSGMRLEQLDVSGSRVQDLSPLSGMPLTAVDLDGTRVSNLGPLQASPLRSLGLTGTRVVDLAPLKGKGLETLRLQGTALRDFSPLAGMPIRKLEMDIHPFRDEALLASLARLETVNGRPAAEARARGADEAWMAAVAALPAEEQVKRVVAKLRDLNPGFAGEVAPAIEGGQVAELKFQAFEVRNLSPLRALAGLRRLHATGRMDPGFQAKRAPLADLLPLKGMMLQELNLDCTEVSDLSPLRGMRLANLDVRSTRVLDLGPLEGMPLSYLRMDWTGVADLSPLRGMPLRRVYLGGSKVADLSVFRGMPLEVIFCNLTRVRTLEPLRGLPLRDLLCDFIRERDLEVVKSLRQLRTINATPIAVFLDMHGK